MRNAKKHPFIPLHAPIFIKQIDFNEKVVSDVTSVKWRMRGACVAPLM